MRKKVWMEWSLPPALLPQITGLAEYVDDGDMDKLRGSTVISGIRRYYDGEFMDRVGPELVQIAKPGIGVDNIDLDAATSRGILVCNTPDAPSESTAEHAVALLMAVAKRVIVGDMQLRGAADIGREEMLGTELFGSSLGIVGFGRIGRRVAEMTALGIRMKVTIYDPLLPDDFDLPEGVSRTEDLDAVFAENQFVTLHTPLLPETRHLANERRLRLMKRGSYLINASRGGVLDEDALIRVLEEGHLAGAALDVFDPEPPLADNPLLRMRNVVITPHIASYTDAGMAAMQAGTVENIVNVLKGERPRWIANPEAWPGRTEPANA
ncbi:MAG: hydroxyacid dehydrogenase [Caldilineaceae bacterium SB0668_bin_21]|nr:hydroxyacid dehydrogenase [Caldilineaceae bacterium SB0668_bin_21]MYC21573.1 hydroxyacid dehydrogenase [Caldilineaceae bacterium SB0662_bin_25]